MVEDGVLPALQRLAAGHAEAVAPDWAIRVELERFTVYEVPEGAVVAAPLTTETHAFVALGEKLADCARFAGHISEVLKGPG